MFFIFVEALTEEEFSGGLFFILPEVDSAQVGAKFPLEGCFSALQKSLKRRLVLEECFSIFQRFYQGTM
jgi:hypothetical protein